MWTGELPGLSWQPRCATSRAARGSILNVTAGLLAAYGIPLVVAVGVSSPQEAVATADQPGYPVTPKSRSGEMLNPCLHLQRWIMQFRRMASSAFPQARGLSPGAWCTAGLA
jgi:hypothetical protein